MALDEGIMDSVANSNMKTVAEAAAFYAGLAMGDAVDHQRRTRILSEAALGATIKGLVEIDPSEAVATLKATSGNEVASQLAALIAALSSNQQGIKTAQSTPPPTP